MRINKYFLASIFLFGALFFSLGSVPGASAQECCMNAAGCSPMKTNSCPTTSGFVQVTCENESACSARTSTTTFVNPIAFTTVSEVVMALLNNLRGAIVTVAVLMIVIGGMMYIQSGGDEKKIAGAKSAITAAMIGLAIALAAPTLLKEIQIVLGGTNPAVTNPDEVLNADSLREITMRVLNLLLSIVGIIAIIGLVIGGMFYFTAYGDDKRIETGKKIITSSMIGIAVVMAALVIVKEIAALMGVN